MLIRFFDRFLYLIFLESFGNNIYCATTDWNNTGYYTAGDYTVVPGDNCMEENNQISEQSTQHVTGFYDSNSFQNPYYSDSHLLEIVMNAGDNTALESCQYDKVPFQQYNNDLTTTGLYDQTYEQNYLQNNETTLNYCDLYSNEIAEQSFSQLPSASCCLSNYPQTQNSSISNTENTEAYADQHISPLEYGIDQAFEQSIPQLTELNPYKYSESREIENAYEKDKKVLNKYNFSRTEDETSSISICNMQNTDFQKTVVDMPYTSTNPNIIIQNENSPIIYNFDQRFMLPSTIETQNNPNPGIIYNNTYNDENAFNFTFDYANDQCCGNEKQSFNSEVCTTMDGLIENDVRHQRKRKIEENDRLSGKNKTLCTNAETSINKSSISQVCKCCNNSIPVLNKEEVNKRKSLIIRNKRRARSIPPNIKELRQMKFLRHETSRTLYRLTKFFRYKTIKEFIAKHDIKLKFRFTRNLGLLNIYYADWIEIHTLRGIIDLKNTLYIKFFEKEYAVFLKEMNDILYRINLQKKILHSATDYNKQHLIFDTLINILNEQLNITENNANYKLTILSWYLTRGMGDMHDRIDLKSLSCILNLDRSTFEITKSNESRMLHLLKLELSRIQFKAAIEVIHIESAKVQHKNPDAQFLEEQSKKIYTVVLDSIKKMDMYLASVENLFHHFKADITAIKNQSEKCQNEVKMNWDKQV
ncbi:hypothetical protein SLOPH_1101 [Spraguea lophii 42_110]|uniref:Uncharacterized protein n=1 Tax=Spraguea lophii (strain 42_110) TaxID=1358809 RepID=S7W6V9_SPRLO|nr:hypothetical protein SLOPH_1101 [Spraguea lophii 42_110]